MTILLLAKFLPSNRGSYTPPVPPTPPTPSSIQLGNRGPVESFSYTAVPVEGETETGTLAAGSITTLAKTVKVGDAVSTVYSSITITYEGESPRTLDVTKTATESVTTYEASNLIVEGNIITLRNPYTNPELTVVYKAVGDGADTTVTLEPGAGLDLSKGVPTDSSIGDVYYYIQVWQDDTLYYLVNLETNITDDTVIQIIEQTIYTVTFNSNGGTEVDSQMVPDGQRAEEPPPPTKDGYTFNKWQYNGTDWDFTLDTVQSDMTLDAVWTSTQTWTVTFEAYVGTPEPQAQTVADEGLIEEPATAPSIANADIPQGYSGDGSYNGWFENDYLWNFQTDTVVGDMTLSTYYNVYRTITFLDEYQGNTYATSKAYYPFSSGPAATHDYVAAIEQSDPEDPQGTGRTFGGWAYYDADTGNDIAIDFVTGFPDGGDLGVAEIPVTVTEVYALWDDSSD